jgi:hypothetical protein
MAELGRWLGNFSGPEGVRDRVSLAAMFWSIWKTQNGACFDNVLYSDPCDIIYMICHLLDYWCEMQKPKVQEGLQQGNELVKRILQQIFSRAKGWAPPCQRIANS